MRAVALLCLALVGLSQGFNFRPNPQTTKYAKPWKEGKNICASIKAPGTPPIGFYSFCLPWVQDYCGVKSSFAYNCCPGFVRCPKFGNKCVERERTWKNIPDHLRMNDYGRFADLLTKGAAHKPLTDDSETNTHTIFAPYDDRLVNSAELNLKSFNGQGKNHPVLFTVLKGRVYTDNLRNGMTLATEFKDQHLKVTKYSNGILCIECREMVQPNHEAKNGVIHYINGIPTPHVGAGKKRGSVMELLQNDPETTSFARSIPSDLRAQLANPKSIQWFTVFAPANGVWNRIKSTYPGQAETIARNHVIKNMFCKAAMVGSNQILGNSEAGEELRVACPGGRGGGSGDGSGQQGGPGSGPQRVVRSLFGPPAGITRPDLMARNGVVHVINQGLVPSAAMTFNQLLRTGGLKNYVGDSNWPALMQNCDLRMRSGNSYAVLIPNGRAFMWWQNYQRFRKYYDRFQTDAEFRCRLIRFHIAAMKGGRESTLPYLWLQQSGYRTNNKDKQWEVDYFLKRAWGSQLYFHYSPVAGFRSFPFRSGSVYIIDRVNTIPEKRLVQVLRDTSYLSTMSQKTQQAKFDSNVFRPNEPRNLYLAIRNNGWTGQGQGAVQGRAYSGEQTLRQFLMLHYVRNWLWGGDIGYFENGTRHRFMSGAGVELIFDRENDGTMYIGYQGLARNLWAKVVEWNLFAIDGNIWVLDRPLVCPPNICGGKKKILEREVWKVLSFACWESLRANRGVKAKDMEPWLDKVEGSQCYTNRDTPKKESSTHGG